MKTLILISAIILSTAVTAAAQVHAVFFQRPSRWSENVAPSVKVWNDAEPADDEYVSMTKIESLGTGQNLYVYTSDQPFTYARFAHTDFNYIGNYSGVYELRGGLNLCNEFDGGTGKITNDLLLHSNCGGEWGESAWEFVSGTLFRSPQFVLENQTEATSFGAKFMNGQTQTYWFKPKAVDGKEDNEIRFKLIAYSGSAGTTVVPLQLNQAYYLLLDVVTMEVVVKPGFFEDDDEPFVFDTIETIRRADAPYYLSDFNVN